MSITANLLSSRSQISSGEFIGSPAGHAELPALHYSIQDVMMVLVSMQKEAQRREESFQRSLMKLKEKLQSQVSYATIYIITWIVAFPAFDLAFNLNSFLLRTKPQMLYSIVKPVWYGSQKGQIQVSVCILYILAEGLPARLVKEALLASGLGLLFYQASKQRSKTH